MTDESKTETEDKTAEPAASSAADSGSSMPRLSSMHVVGITALGLALLIVFVMFAADDEGREVAGGNAPVIDARADSTAPVAEPVAAVTSAPPPAPVSAGDVTGDGLIERKGEGRHFYTTIRIPPGAETLYLSGSGASRQEDGSMGDMERQVIDTFTSFKETLEAEGWSLSDIVQVRAFAVADEFGTLDFDGFNRGYRRFFGTEENPMKPVRSFVEIAGLVVPGWLVEIEIRAARMPD